MIYKSSFLAFTGYITGADREKEVRVFRKLHWPDLSTHVRYQPGHFSDRALKFREDCHLTTFNG